MMISIGHLAKRFGMLPSQVRDYANTYDIMIADVMSSWEEYQTNKNKGAPPNVKESDMMEILRKAREG